MEKSAPRIFDELLRAVTKDGVQSIAWTGHAMTDKEFQALVGAMEVSPVAPEVLDVANNGITSDGFSNLIDYLISEKCKLREVNFARNSVDDVGAKSLLQKLQDNVSNSTLLWINLEGNHVDSTAILNQINVVLKCNALSEELSRQIRSGSGTVLDLSGKSLQSIDKAILPYALRRMSQLEQVILSRCSLGDAGAWEVGELLATHGAHIRHLDLSDNGITNVGFDSFITASNLAHHPSLESIDMSQNGKVGNEAARKLIATLKENGVLKEVLLAKTCVTESTIKAVVHACNLNKQPAEVKATVHRLASNDPHVVDLNLQWNPPSLEGLLTFVFPALEGNKYISSVNLGNCGLGDVGVKQLTDVLRSSASIRSVGLSNNGITSDGAIFFFQMAQRHSTIEEVNFANNKIDSTAVSAIVSAVKLSRAIRILNLENNPLPEEFITSMQENILLNQSPEVMRTIIPAVEGNAALVTTLNLSVYDGKQYQNDASVSILARALASNTRVSSVDLSHNVIGDVGVSHLAEMLTKNQRIRKLNLASNSVTNRGAQLLSLALKRNTSLQELDLSDNAISDAGVEGFIDMLRDNDTLSSVVLCNTHVSGLTLQNIILACDMNRHPLSLKRTLAYLQVGEAPLTRIDLSAMPNDAPRNRLTDDSMKLVCFFLRVTSFVTVLELRNNELGAESCKELAVVLESPHCCLEKVNLSGNPIPDEGAIFLARALGQNTTLRELHLGETAVTDAGVQSLTVALRHNASVVNIVAPDCVSADALQAMNRELITNAQPQPVKRILAGLEQNDPALTEIAVHDPNLPLDDVGVRLLSVSLLNNTVATRIDLSGNCITSIGAAYLAEAVEENPRIISIDLSNNRIDDVGGQRLTKLLEKNSSILELNTAGNSITEAVTTEIDYLLLVNSGPLSLKRFLLALARGDTQEEALDLNGDHGDRKFDDESVHLLCSLLHSTRHVKHVDLRGNNITDEGAAIISDYLRISDVLETLRLDDNPISAHGGEMLYSALKRNPVLHTLTLTGTGVADVTIENIASLLHVNAVKLREAVDMRGKKVEDLDDETQFRSSEYAVAQSISIAAEALRHYRAGDTLLLQ